MKIAIHHEGHLVGTIATADNSRGYDLTGDTAMLRKVLAGLTGTSPDVIPPLDAQFLATIPQKLHGWYWYAKAVEE